MEKSLTEEQLLAIEETVSKAEKLTSCEIVPVLANSSDKYLHASTIFGFIMALLAYLAFIGLWPYMPAESWDGLSRVEYHFAVVGLMSLAFIVGVFLSQLYPILKLPFISQEEMALRVRRRARQAYFDYCRGRTSHNTGIVVYVSLFEHIVIVQGDNEVSKKISQSEWDDVCQLMLAQLKKGALCQAYCDGILQLGKLVSAQFPANHSSIDQLANRVRFVRE